MYKHKTLNIFTNTIFLFLFFFSSGNCKDQLVFDLKEGLKIEEIDKFENSYIKCFKKDCLSKIGEYKILLEFDKNKILQTVKIFFPELDYEEKRKLEKEWLEDFELLNEETLRFIDNGSLNSKKIRLFSNNYNKSLSKYIASIFINNKDFYLAFYSNSEGKELLNYLEKYNSPHLGKLILDYFKDSFLVFFNN